MLRALAQDEGLKQFRYAFVLKPGFDFSALKPHCEKIIYATDGYVLDVNEIVQQLEESLQGFDENKDVIIPVGSTIACYLAGAVLQKKLQKEVTGKEAVSFAMGIFADGGYRFFRVLNDASQESYEVIF